MFVPNIWNKRIQPYIWLYLFPTLILASNVDQRNSYPNYQLKNSI